MRLLKACRASEHCYRMQIVQKFVSHADGESFDKRMKQ